MIRLLRACSVLVLAAAAWIAAPVHAHEGHGHAAALERAHAAAESLDSRVGVRAHVPATIESVPSCPDPDGGCCSCRHGCCGSAQPHLMAAAPLARWNVEPAPQTAAFVFHVTQLVPAPRAQRAHGARAPPPLTQS